MRSVITKKLNICRSNILLSLHDRNASGDLRFLIHSPWSDVIWYFDLANANTKHYKRW